MNLEIEKKYQRLRSFFFGLCILAAGLFFLITSKNILKTQAAESWQTYSGVMENQRNQGYSLFRTNWLKYTYEIDGKKYQGTRIGYGISRTDEIRLSSQSVKVYVNPDDYTDAVLVTGVKKSHYIGLLFSAGFMWLGFYLWRRTA